MLCWSYYRMIYCLCLVNNTEDKEQEKIPRVGDHAKTSFHPAPSFANRARRSRSIVSRRGGSRQWFYGYPRLGDSNLLYCTRHGRVVLPTAIVWIWSLRSTGLDFTFLSLNDTPSDRQTPCWGTSGLTPWRSGRSPFKSREYRFTFDKYDVRKTHNEL